MKKTGKDLLWARVFFLRERERKRECVCVVAAIRIFKVLVLFSPNPRERQRENVCSKGRKARLLLLGHGYPLGYAHVGSAFGLIS